MSAFRPKGRRVLTVKVPTRDGACIVPAVRLSHAPTAKRVQASLLELAAQFAWDVLERVARRELTAASVHLMWVGCGRDLPTLRASLEDVDLAPHVVTWHKALCGPSGGIARDTADHYLSAVRTLIPKDAPFARSEFTPARLQQWVDEMAGVEAGTVRKRGAGMRRFTAHLVRRGVLASDPMRDVKLPPAGAPLCRYLTTAEAKRLADAQPEPYRTFSALLAGSGIEVSTALRLRVRDVDRANREIRAAGTKTHNRDRVVRVAEWAWAYVEPLLKSKHADARLFPEIPNRWAPQEPHEEAVALLVAKGFTTLEGYTMRDQRHTYAVRAIRAGTPPELVARQLGHKDAVLVHRVYGKFAPTQAERDKWERIAATQDEAAEETGQ
jgi:integrase